MRPGPFTAADPLRSRGGPRPSVSAATASCSTGAAGPPPSPRPHSEATPGRARVGSLIAIVGRLHRQGTPRNLLIASILLLVATGCSTAPTAHHTPPSSVRPDLIIPGPAQALGVSAPTSQGTVWVLAGTATAKTLHLIDLASRSSEAVVPVSAAAVAVAVAQGGWLGIGTATSRTGALQIWSQGTRVVAGTVPLSGPVLAMAASGNRFFVLTGTPSSASVAVVDSATRQLVESVPAPAGAVAVSPASGGHSLWVLRSDGLLDEIALDGGEVSVQFGTGSGGVARALAVAPGGATVYVLRNSGRVSSVAVVATATESVTKVLPAPASTVDLVLSRSGATLYDLVGTPTVGNLQAFPLRQGR